MDCRFEVTANFQPIATHIVEVGFFCGSAWGKLRITRIGIEQTGSAQAAKQSLKGVFVHNLPFIR
ncbi:hypothetical protein A1356_18840 [Methylomonas koyamae]|uniref:Uncharacterized protein n=1 Tax=Methylomonas koyamae TaxID=702114 RepID=A0AA91D9P7_9GAMM|nr:hypothetical protein A1356_18840 [Methylomonas koyamae]